MSAMRPPTVSFAKPTTRPRKREQAGVRLVILMLACLFLGFGSGVLWYYRITKHAGENADLAAGGRLSPSSKEVLQHLDSPIQIRFYHLLDPASTSDALRAFAGRVDELLSEFQAEAKGKIDVIRYSTPSDAAAKAASGDGMKPFNLDKGEACYLGLAVACKTQKQSLPQLSAEWEQALELDLTRAIVRVAGEKPVARNPAATSQTDAAAADAVRRSIPNLGAVSMEDGKRILTEVALKDFKAAVDEMEIQIQKAEERFRQAQNGGSEAEQQAALQQLQQIRAEQAQRSKQIAQRLQAQMAAFERLKAE